MTAAPLACLNRKMDAQEVGSGLSADKFRALSEVIGPVCKAHHILIRLYLFGSRARGEERPGSDYDFYAVLDYDVVDNIVPHYLSLIQGLESVLQCEIDFVSGEVWTTRDITLKDEIDRDKVLVYNRDAK